MISWLSTKAICGQTGKGRSIAIKDDKGKIVKEWKFANATGSNESMVIPAKELLQLAKTNSKTHLTLYYYISIYIYVSTNICR